MKLYERKALNTRSSTLLLPSMFFMAHSNDSSTSESPPVPKEKDYSAGLALYPSKAGETFLYLSELGIKRGF